MIPCMRQEPLSIGHFGRAQDPAENIRRRSRILREDGRIGSEVFANPVEFFLCPRTTELMLTRHILSLPLLAYHNISV